MAIMSIVTRFAPSPTGYLHLGHAFSALTAWQRARSAGGRFLLRIEDIDPGRCRPDFVAAIEEDLRWLGLDWDGPIRIQSAHFGEYQAALDTMVARGLLYPCFCTRAEIMREVAESATAPHTPDGGVLYPGTCLRLPAHERQARTATGIPFALRLNLARALAFVGRDLAIEEEGQAPVRCDPRPFGDAVLARKDAPASYHLCVTHDDALQGVTLVTRGADLRPATHLHRLIQALMGWPAPRYAHHPLLRDPSGLRFSKRDGAQTLRQLRADGLTPAAVRSLATRLAERSG